MLDVSRNSLDVDARGKGQEKKKNGVDKGRKARSFSSTNGGKRPPRRLTVLEKKLKTKGKRILRFFHTTRRDWPSN